MILFLPFKGKHQSNFSKKVRELVVEKYSEIIKDSKALQELPEKSFEALNRFLDSIVPEEKQEE